MGFWGTKWQMKAKVSNAARVRYLNQSTWLCRPQVGQMASLVKKSFSYKLRSYPSANLWNPKLSQIKGWCHEASRFNSLFCLCLIPKLSKSMAQPDCCCRLTRAERNGIVASGCVWRPPSLHEIFLIPYDVHLHFFERSGSTWTRFQTQCNLWKRKKLRVSYKLSEASRLNSLFCLCLIPKLSKSMAQPDCCCRLTRAEINGIVASGCVWRPPSLHGIILIPYDVHLHFLLFTFFFWKILFYLNQIPNSVQPMKTEKMPISYKLSEASRLNSLFCLCLIPKLSKSMAQPDCCCRLTRADRIGIVASGCVWRPPSLHEIIFIALIWYPSPLPALHMFLLKDLVLLEPNSKLSATYENGKNCASHTSYLKSRD